MKKLSIFCSLLVIVLLATQAQEIPPMSKGNSEVRMKVGNKVVLYSEEQNKKMSVDEELLLQLLSTADTICIKLDVYGDSVIKTVDLRFTSEGINITGAYFESKKYAATDNAELFVAYIEFDIKDRFEAKLSKNNRKLIKKLNKFLQSRNYPCKEDHTD